MRQFGFRGLNPDVEDAVPSSYQLEKMENLMFYFNNLPTWERIVRVLAAAAMLFCAWHFLGKPAGYVFLAIGLITLATAAVGFCPACALAGRRLAKRAQTSA